MTVVESEAVAERDEEFAQRDQELIDNLDSLLELYVTVRGAAQPGPNVHPWTHGLALGHAAGCCGGAPS